MPHLHCTHCGLHVKIQAERLFIENCPRCLGRRATVAPMTLSSTWLRPDTTRLGLALATGSPVASNVPRLPTRRGRAARLGSAGAPPRSEVEQGLVDLTAIASARSFAA